MPNITRFGGGSGESLTLLWSNSSPTASFAAQTITLSDSLANYSKVRIVYKSNSTDTIDENLFIEHSTAESALVRLVEKSFAEGAQNNFISICRSNEWTARGARQMCFPSANTYNKLKIENAQFYSSNSLGTDNTKMIPIYIYGVK